MRKQDIIAGKTYTNGKGRVRKVIAKGPEYIAYPGQEDLDCVRFEIVHDGSKKNASKGRKANSTREAFAAWAKAIVEEEEVL